jgi:peptidoglycan/xylan/chitin deacetylase (PgdA/CDA1 family)
MTIIEQIQELRVMTVNQLRERYKEVFDESTTARNKDYLWKKIAWGIQEKEYGGLTERAKRRAKEITNEQDIRVRPPRGAFKENDDYGRPRTKANLPAPGTILTREYKGISIEVEVLEEGFLYATQVYKSLSAIAKDITGTHRSGPAFFNLREIRK